MHKLFGLSFPTDYILDVVMNNFDHWTNRDWKGFNVNATIFNYDKDSEQMVDEKQSFVLMNVLF